MKIEHKLTLTYLAVLLIAFLTAGILFNVLISFAFKLKVHEQLVNESQKIAVRIDQAGVNELSKGPGERNIEVYGRKLPYQVAVVDNLGKAIYKSWNDNAGKELNNRRYVKVITPLNNGNLVLYAPNSQFQQMNNLLNLVQTISLALGGLIAYLIAVLAKRYFMRPLKQLMRSMDQFNLNNTFEPIDIKTGDEIEEIGKCFSRMTARLKIYNEQQKRILQNISHALKTPLMSIQGNAEAIKDGVVEGSEVDDSLEIIMQESQRLKKTVEDIIGLIQIETINPKLILEKMNVANVFRNAINGLKPVYEQKGIDLQIDGDANLKAWFDEERLTEAVVNILNNDLRYAENSIRIEYKAVNNNLVIRIEDDGPGFKQGEEDLVFERFYKGNKGETGLGLSITKAIIEGHGGRIRAENRITKGAVFILEIPIGYG